MYVGSYLILDVLGAGTFGQVVKCQNTKTKEIVAVKVVKNKQAYFNQSMMELAILEMVTIYACTVVILKSFLNVLNFSAVKRAL